MITKLFEGDQRCEVLLEALTALLYERGKGIPIPSILGVIELLKIQVLEDSKN